MMVCPECGDRTHSASCRADGCPTVNEDWLRESADPNVGKLIADRYRIIGLVGRGGMGAVYKAYQKDMRRILAIKIASNLPSDAAATKRFLREVRVISGLTHPNTIRIFDYGQLPDGQLFFTMEFLEGEPLNKLLSHEEQLSDARILHIAEQVLKSLGEAHAAGIVHRDLSPENIFLVRQFGEEDFVKVLDFGVAKGSFLNEDDDEKLTMAGVFIGKPAYASPEQAEGADNLDGRSDLYSLGVVLYRLIAGEVPFISTTPMRVLMMHIHEEPRPLAEVARHAVRRDLSTFIMRLLEKKPEDRYQNAAEALREIQRIQDSMAVEGQAKSFPALQEQVATVQITTGQTLKAASPRRRKQRRLVWGTVAFVTVGIAVTLLLVTGAGSSLMERFGFKTTDAGETVATKEAPAKALPKVPVTSPVPEVVKPVVKQPPVTQPALSETKPAVRAVEPPAQTVAASVDKPVSKPAAKKPAKPRSAKPKPKTGWSF